MKIQSPLTVVLVVALCISSCLAEDCNTSRLNLIGSYTLGKQDELNKTFTKIAEKLTVLGDVTFKPNDTVVYNITQASPKFFYIDSRQKAEVVGNDTIIISGGRLDVEIDFKWAKQDLIKKEGTGHARAMSAPITFVKNITIVNQTYSFELLDYQEIDILNPINLTRIEPADVSEQDKKNLLRLLNDILNVHTIRLELENQINKGYAFYLRNFLHEQKQPIQDHFDYVWAPGQGKPNTTITISRRGVSIDIEKDGIILKDDLQIKGDTNWICPVRNVPEIPLNARLFGHTQEMMSLDFYENGLRYAINSGILNTDLNRQNWESRMFQFYAGDLYEVLPLTQSRFRANVQVSGFCKPTTSNLKVAKAAGNDTLNVTIHFGCELNVEKQKVLGFDVGLILETQGVIKRGQLNFKARSFIDLVSFYPYGDFKVLNHELAAAMVRHSLNRLQESNLFGSGFPLHPDRDYPHFQTYENYTLIYDSTHVDL